MILGKSGTYVKDDTGQWWWHDPISIGRRMRVFPTLCEYCQEEFIRRTSRNPAPTHCSKKCSGACKRRGAPFHKPHEFHGTGAPRWRGGRRIIRGYVFIWVGDNHPAFKGTARKYLAEHRMVMEQKLGRPLLKTERVHHKNGVKTDNHPDNLELWNFGHPSGQRVGEGKHCPTCTCGQPHE